jgi:hypothetical protein
VRGETSRTAAISLLLIEAPSLWASSIRFARPDPGATGGRLIGKPAADSALFQPPK